MKKISTLILKFRTPILILAICATAAGALLIPSANINYDLTAYLSEDTFTRRSLDLMEREFGPAAQLTVMLTEASDGRAEALAEAIGALPGVLTARYQPETDEKIVDGMTYRRLLIALDGTVENDRVLDGIESALAGDRYDLSGDAVNMRAIRASIGREIPIVMAIAAFVVLAVLLLTSHSWIEPALFGIVLIVSIIVNMGTNWIFPSISFITFAVTAILQLALAMDYSIMLLHSYNQFLDGGMTEKDAVVAALTRSALPIASSSLTTVAGLAALMFMSFTIGFDIGIVLSKGILISMLTVFLLLPALILRFSGLLQRTRHKAFSLGGGHVGRFAWRTRKGLPIMIVALIALGFALQTDNQYQFSVADGDPAEARIAAVFGESNPMIALFPRAETDGDYEKQLRLIGEIQALELDGAPVLTSALAYPTVAGAALKSYTADEAAGMLGVAPLVARMFYAQQGFEGAVRGDRLLRAAHGALPENEELAALVEQLALADQTFNGQACSRILFSMNMPHEGAEAFEIVEQVEGMLRAEYEGEVGLVGNAVSCYDIAGAFESDLMRVSLITIVAVFLIVALSFRSALVPTILVCVIQGAIWINMAISRVAGQSIFFMSYLICLAIQMGATIDYGILLTDNYRTMRATLDRREAMLAAMRMSLPTIFTSGLILVAAGFAIGEISSVFYISSIGLLLGRGALISIAMVLVFLPQLLTLCDRLIAPKGLRGKAEM